MRIPSATRYSAIAVGTIGIMLLTGTSVPLLIALTRVADKFGFGLTLAFIALTLLFVFLGTWMLSFVIPPMFGLTGSTTGSITRLYTKQSYGKLRYETRYFADIGKKSFWIDHATHDRLHLNDQVEFWYMKKWPPHSWLDPTHEVFHCEKLD